MPRITHANKIKMATLFRQGLTVTEIAKKCKVSVSSVTRNVKEWENNPLVDKAVKSYEQQREYKIEKIADTMTKEYDDIIIELKNNARTINLEAVKRIHELIPDEKDLNKLLKAYELSSAIIAPAKSGEPVPVTKIVNLFQDINNQLLVQDAKN